MKFRAVFATLLLIFTFSLQAFAADQVYYYHTDPAGTPLSMTDSNGTMVWKADYKPFGEEYAVTGSAANDKRFVGKEKDEETGLSYFGARYQDGRLGRFSAVDTVRAVNAKNSKTNEKLLINPQRLNTYSYGLNNPYRYVDPDGRNPILIGLGIIWLAEMAMPQTMGSSHRDSFIDNHKADLFLMPLGIEREAANITSSAAGSLWKFGANKSPQKWVNQMTQRGWNEKQISEAISQGEKFAAENLVNKGNAATRHVHPSTGQSVVQDNVTKEIIHVGGKNFGY